MHRPPQPALSLLPPLFILPGTDPTQTRYPPAFLLLLMMMMGVLIFCCVSQVIWGACPHVAMETAYRCAPFFLLPPPPPPVPPKDPKVPAPDAPNAPDAPDARLELPVLIFIVVSLSLLVLLTTLSCRGAYRTRTRENGPNQGGSNLQEPTSARP
ncbi:PREDICTED: proline-rich membrane anchor 1-like [Poecilia mexicana]|uniref:proline-rich membrane anchor 1-like n=1 Tax=Poecilia mexicana TaxID=48701 RepID=UPI00072EC183|nr:PREDICTED: proline-rich membrane anchor 1-like [Poecilia mexicana]